MEGTIVNFRRGMHTQTPNHIVIHISDDSNREKASELVGRTVVWKSTAGKEITGKIAAAHGNKGAVRAIFEKGLPGQSAGTKVEIK